MESPEARSWLLDRKITANEVGPGFVSDTRAYLDQPGCQDARRFLIGGLATDDLPANRGPRPSAWPGGSGGPRLPDAAAAEHALHARHRAGSTAA